MIETIRQNDNSVQDAAEYLGRPAHWIEACLAYYADYQDEIDEWAAQEKAFAEREEARWRRRAAAARLKLLLDEMYSAAIAVQLRRRNHDVIAVLERSDLRRQTDESCPRCRHERRPCDRDEEHPRLRRARRPLALEHGSGHPGLLLTSDRSLPRRKAEHRRSSYERSTAFSAATRPRTR